MFTDNVPIWQNRFSATLFAGAAGVLIAVVGVWAGIPVLNSNVYGVWLFVITPFVLGVVVALLFNHRRRATTGETRALILVTLMTGAAVLLAGGLEGAICLLMALPLAIPLALVGGTIGRWAAGAKKPAGPPAMLVLFAIPLTALLEPPA